MPSDTARKGLAKLSWGSDKPTAQVNSLRNGVDSDIEPIENNFKDPEDGFWDNNSPESIVRNSEVPR